MLEAFAPKEAAAGELQATAEHVIHCFDVLAGHFNGHPAPTPQFDDAHCPLFVTWNKESRRGGDVRLRGCIGTLEPRQLHTALTDYALTSAFRDRRFSPVERSELPLLHCSVSLLHSFERAASWDSWAVGRHGIVLEFADPASGERRSATYLPYVAQDEGWSVSYTVESLARKAGYHGPVTGDLRSEMRVTRYQCSAFALSYREHVDWRAATGPGGQQRVVTVTA